MLALSLEVPKLDLDQEAMILSLKAARERVLDPASPAGAKDAIWSQLVHLASGKKEPWCLAAIWMMVPGLRRICHRCRRYGTTLGLRELEPEAVAGLVEALHAADPNRLGLAQAFRLPEGPAERAA
ncbi:hypothetical protein [Frankia sp. Cppng1_Ct_nod]|uniref:hypothetical protein n=1 Tax=Frankia sp. Cppng1_Ct_nod TaxID=2897162 RepID=UPI0020242950|nr:hypothetical protein [Frankia sp. Cppng1_Ct_nod]